MQMTSHNPSSIETTKVAILVERHYWTTASNTKNKQSSINWKSQDKYLGLCNFKIKVMNIVLTNTYNIHKSKIVPNIIMNWLGHKGLKFVQTLNDTEQEKCRISVWLVEAWYSLEQYIGLKEDKLSSTTVDFIRSEGNLETKHLYCFRKPKMC